MAIFLIRVVLHKHLNLSHPDYNALHAAMEDGGFSRQIKSDKDVWYHLPPAEYVIEGDYTIKQIQDKAKNVIKGIDTDYGIISAETKYLRWFGLKEV